MTAVVIRSRQGFDTAHIVASKKRKHDHIPQTMSAQEFLQECCYDFNVAPEILMSVPEDVTVKDTRSHFHDKHHQNANPFKNWFGQLKHDALEKIKEKVKHAMSPEDALRQKRIVCIGSGTNENDMQRKLKEEDELIECKLQETNRAQESSRNDLTTLVLGCLFLVQVDMGKQHAASMAKFKEIAMISACTCVQLTLTMMHCPSGKRN